MRTQENGCESKKTDGNPRNKDGNPRKKNGNPRIGMDGNLRIRMGIQNN
jgi:hypothetical protein